VELPAGSLFSFFGVSETLEESTPSETGENNTQTEQSKKRGLDKSKESELETKKVKANEPKDKTKASDASSEPEDKKATNNKKAKTDNTPAKTTKQSSPVPSPSPVPTSTPSTPSIVTLFNFQSPAPSMDIAKTFFPAGKEKHDLLNNFTDKKKAMRNNLKNTKRDKKSAGQE